MKKGTKVIVRCDRAGVFYGELETREGQEVTLTNARKLWYWDGAASTMQLAMDGVTKPSNCKFTMNVNEVILTDAIEIIPCTEEASRSLEGVSVWKK